MSRPRVSQKSIALKLGLTQATISLALRNDPSISKKTCELVAKTAQALNYTPDPYLSGLASYRKQVKPAQFQATLAWLSNDSDGHKWEDSETFRDYHAGAVQRAMELGYAIEDFALNDSGMTPDRMNQILKARGIGGLLLAPQPAPKMALDFKFERYSVVTFGYTLIEPQLNVVTFNQFRSMEIAVSKLVDLGYQRPGIAIAENSDQRSDHNWSAAFWSQQRQLLDPRNCIPLFLPKKLDQDAMNEWVAVHQPDVVISIDPIVGDWLGQIATESSFTRPDFAMVSVPHEGTRVTGMWQNPKIIGAKAVDLLVDMIHRGERGVPEVPLCQLIDGTWVEGETAKGK